MADKNIEHVLEAILKLDMRLNSSDARLTETISKLDMRLTEAISKLDTRLTEAILKSDTRFNGLDARLTEGISRLDTRFNGLDARLTNLDMRLSGIERDIVDIKDDIRKIGKWIAIENSDIIPDLPANRKAVA